jgi:hypothetical protein
MKLVNLYNLKKDTELEKYRKWNIEVDQKRVLEQPGIISLEVYEVKRTNKEMPIKFVDIVEVESMEKYKEIIESEPMEEVKRKWSEYADEDSLIMLEVEKLE